MEVLDWCGNSPDMNPIEHFWSFIIIKMAEKQPITAEELVTATKKFG